MLYVLGLLLVKFALLLNINLVLRASASCTDHPLQSCRKSFRTTCAAKAIGWGGRTGPRWPAPTNGPWEESAVRRRNEHFIIHICASVSSSNPIIVARHDVVLGTTWWASLSGLSSDSTRYRRNNFVLLSHLDLITVSDMWIINAVGSSWNPLGCLDTG